jgi:FlgD Ig-like domain
MKSHHRFAELLIAGLLVAAPAAASPATPVEIPIQGVARDAADQVIPSGNVVVRIFADSLGATALYDSGTEFNGAIVQGIFDINVGRTTPLLIDHDQSFFLELDVAGTEVIGNAAHGRERFFSGGGGHARPDLEARLDALETAMDLAQSPPGTGPTRSSLRLPTAASRPTSPRITNAFSNQHGLLGFGKVSGNAAGLSAAGTLLAQPVGIRATGAIQAWLGPLDLSTPPPNPLIRSVHDVPNDQGRAVRIVWRSDQRERAAGPARSGPAGNELLALPPGAWDVLTTIPATLDTTYQTVVTTLCDSNSAGLCWSIFLVRSITDRVGTYHNSVADSGASIDNLAPGVPAGLNVQAIAGGTQLSWQASAAPDFQYFRVYRSTDPGFVPGATTLVHATATPGWVDSQVGSFTYKVTAVDANGNESAPAVSTLVTGVESEAPKTLRFASVVPNPFRERLSLVIEVPEASGHVALAWFDVTGRRVRSLLDAPLAAGRYALEWDGRTDEGGHAAPGVYVARLSAAGRTLTRRATLLP